MNSTPRTLRVHTLLLSLCVATTVALGCAEDDTGVAEDDEDTDHDAGGDTDTDTGTGEDCGPQEVTHPVTGQVWKRCPVGGDWEWSSTGCRCVGGMIATYSWSEIQDLCDDGFRVATAEELLTTMEGCDPWADVQAAGSGSCTPCQQSELCPSLFGNEGRFHWTATEDPGNPDAAWYVAFNVGTVGRTAKTTNYYVRCVAQ